MSTLTPAAQAVIFGELIDAADGLGQHGPHTVVRHDETGVYLTREQSEVLVDEVVGELGDPYLDDDLDGTLIVAIRGLFWAPEHMTRDQGDRYIAGLRAIGVLPEQD